LAAEEPGAGRQESSRPVPVAKPLSGGFDGVATRPTKPKRKTIITSQDKGARRKLSLLELASELSNVSRACKLMGYSREQFYEIRRNFQTYVAEGPVDRRDEAGIARGEKLARLRAIQSRWSVVGLLHNLSLSILERVTSHWLPPLSS
jgi:hypothetical protein